ncbi:MULTISPECIES: M20 aminoacylase family protein [Chromobacterium]|uniref:Amidohydrolase n=1 Tax=Chromobacterium rhizoryzae TaxID=1778675 RepID=A0AAD0RRQ4_9NEIS|nr:MULTISPECIES: M20 aminoacylase family protein [Chromobacterium]AXT47287.1 amidohydrolase [Chromobacterium rhizoryzae]OQS34607.1 amidohydrolase [Chromobacterium haemolyticum]PTU69501.1 amidohydrolase [Chromobacterium haemolyticum]
MAHASSRFILPEILQHKDAFIDIRRQIHAHPELGFEEQRTSELVAARLREWGYQVTSGIGKTGVVGQLRVGDGPRSLGIRADMDALPIQEATGLSYASLHAGKMHACGHDGHTAILLAAAHYLARSRKFNGTLNLIFQPAEEGLGGALGMLEDGLFQRFPCDAIFALHNAPGLPVGCFALKEGPMAASSDSVDIRLSGKGAHGAMPHFGRDPIIAAAAIAMALQTLVSRDIPASEAGVVSIGALHAGHAHNVIPEHADLKLSVRALSHDTRHILQQRLHELVQLQAQSLGVRADIDYRRISPVLVNTPRETGMLADLIREQAGAASLHQPPQGMMGSEDFAWMLEKAPGCYVLLGNGVDSRGGCMVHNPGYDFNDEALPIGASLWARLTESYLRAG